MGVSMSPILPLVILCFIIVITISELIEKPEPCDFGTGDELQACGWGNTPNVTAARSIPWITSRGDDALFRGGPRTDHTENNGAGMKKHDTSLICNLLGTVPCLVRRL